jgi:hypothetical protein
MGLNRVYRFEQFVWRDVQFPLELTENTCVYGEFVFEVSRSDKTRKIAFHIIDAFVLGGKDIRSLHYIQRQVANFELFMQLFQFSVQWKQRVAGIEASS